MAAEGKQGEGSSRGFGLGFTEQRLGFGSQMGQRGAIGLLGWAISLSSSTLLFPKTENTKEEKESKGSGWDSICAWG